MVKRSLAILAACGTACAIVLVPTRAGAETEDLLESRSQGPDNSEFVSRDLERQSPIFRSTPLLNIRLAGTVRVDGSVIDQDLPGTRPGGGLFDTRRDFSVLASGMTDGGLAYGMEIDVGIHRAKLFLSHGYGRIDLGDAKSATQALAINGGKVMVGSGHYARAGTALVNNGSLAGARVVSYRGQGGTVRFTTPNFGGLTIAGSYTAESDSDAFDDESDGALSPDVGSEDIFSIAGQHTWSYGRYRTVLYAGCEWSNNNNRNRSAVIAAGQAAAVGSSVVGTPATDQELCSFGSKLSGGAYGFAAGYGWANHDVPGIQFANDRQWIDVGAFYNFGPLQVSGGALYLIDEEGFDRHGEVYIYSGSFNYDVAPGLALQGGVSHHVIDDTTLTPDNFSGSRTGLADNDATTFTLSTQVTF